MAKRKKTVFQGTKSTPTYVDKVMLEKAAREDELLLVDDRVKAKVSEYEKKIEEADADLEKLRAALDEKYQAKQAELDAERTTIAHKLADLETRETTVLEAECKLDKKHAQLQADAIAEIRVDEQRIREEEHNKLLETWEKEAVIQRDALVAEIVNQRRTTAIELDMAHKLRIEAEEARLSRIHSADTEIQAKYTQLTEEYQAKLAELKADLAEYSRKKAEYDLEKEDLESERVYIQELKKRYESCSETEVKRLQLKIEHLDEINLVCQEKIAEQSNKIARLEVRAMDNNGQSAEDRIIELEKQLDSSTTQLDEYSNFPSPGRIVELQHSEELLKMQRVELDEIKAQLVTNKAKLSAYALDKRELVNARTTAAALESLNEQLQRKLQYITEQYKSNHESKFQGLLEIDSDEYIPSGRDAFTGSLADLVIYVRNYGASPKRNTKLYYSEETIRVFLASLATSEPASRLIILQGLSGTGKSSLPELFKNALDFKWHSISVQPSWRDNRELLGYDNDFTNRFKETEFTKALYRASSGIYKDDIVLIVLDEMNLARIEYYFADFLSELERRNTNWMVPLISSYFEPNSEQRPQWLNYENGTANIVITKNIWFVGTANNDDSTSLITDKVYDRAQILDMDEREKPFMGKDVQDKTIDFGSLIAMFNKARHTKANCLSEEDWSILNDIDETNLQPMDITFGNRMKNQLDDFVPVYTDCGGTKEGAIDYFLAHKILRKLDEKYDAYVAACLDDLIEALNAYYGEGVFEKCLKKIAIIKKRNFNTGDN